MKTMTCKQLGGACDKEFRASTFIEISELSQNHGMEMFEVGDESHIEAMNRMKGLMTHPEAMKKWMEDKRNEFNALPCNK